jgi:YVTN family beta-propeller protein
MKKLITAVGCLLLSCTLFAQETTIGADANRVTLPNGWSLSPAGRSLPLGDLPLNMVVNHAGNRIAIANNGQSIQSIQLFDPANEKELDRVIISRSWYGLVFSDDDKKLYVGGGHDNRILIYGTDNDRLQLIDSIQLGKKWPTRIGPAGMALDDERKLLYVVTRDDQQLYIVDLNTRQVSAKYALGGEAYTCVLSPDKTELYISCWGCDRVYVFQTATKNIVAEIPVGDNPNELLLSKKGDRLLVANANDNSVSIIDTKGRRVEETLQTSLYPEAPSGSTTNGMAFSRDEKTLYIANADNNCLAVFDVSKKGQSRGKGFIPVGWYPTKVAVIKKKIFVTNGKGFNSLANPYGPNPFGNRQIVLHHEGDPNKPSGVQYIAGLFKGTMSMLEVPDVKSLELYTAQVYRNTPYSKEKELLAAGEPGNPIPQKVGEVSPIKYVFYVIKENRTYDQVLGDMKEGNGDPALVLFGEKITPNQHALAREFVLLDNFYVDGEVSMDGHNWTMGAYATDFLEKNWVNSYGGRGGSYDGEGNRAVANNKGGFLWDHCKKAGVTYRTYGEFTNKNRPTIPSLEGHICPYFRDYDNSFPDTARFYQWKQEFDSLLAAGAVPQFNSVRFGNDHTEGLKKGRPTPYAHVADNDLAVGLFVEHLSKSSIWKETAIFIIEDDAQNGADHVDAHRSTAYLAGGFVKRNFVDHTPYTTSSMLRTMELILGIPPMTQYDAAATPMWRCFTPTANSASFTCRSSTINLKEVNTAMNEWQRLSEKMNFAKEDDIPDLEFNRVLWHGLKGSDVPFPGPRRAAFYRPVKKLDKDGD